MNTESPFPESSGGPKQVSEPLLAALWQQFSTDFPTAKHCMEELCKRAYQDRAIDCRRCGSNEVDKGFGERTIICRSCGEATWLTAGTFFHHIRLPQAWLAAIWLMERGVSISSCQFHKLAGIAYSTAWNIFKKLSTVIEREMPVESQTLPSSLFSRAICKRSRETPARSHPRAEQEDLERSMSANMGDASSPAFAGASLTPPASEELGLRSASPTHASQEATETSQTDPQHGQPYGSVQMSPQEKKVFDLLTGQEMHFDVLCQRSGLPAGEVSSLLIFLELAGHVVRRPGDYYIRTADDMSSQKCAIAARSAFHAGFTAEVERLMVGAIKFLREHYQGISRKYLQNYLAAYWCRMDRKRWPPGSLMQACLRQGPIRDKEIRCYVSPLCVRIPLCQQDEFRIRSSA